MNSTPQSSGPHRIRVRNGSALIVVLWVTGLLSLFVLALAFEMQIQARISSSWRKKLKASQLSRSGVELAKMAIAETKDPDVDNQDPLMYLLKGDDVELRLGAWALARGAGANISRELGDGRVDLSINPVNARIDLNSLIDVKDRDLTYQMWKDLFDAVGVPSENRDELVDCLLDWVDQNENSHLNGVESQYYESLDPPYSSYNGPFPAVDDLILVKGFDQEIPETGRTVFEALEPFLTVYSDSDKLNINSAGVNTLMGFFNMDQDIAEDIVTERYGPDGIAGTDDDDPYENLSDLLSRVPLLDSSIGEHITFSSKDRFKVVSVGRVGDVSQKSSCIMRLKKGEVWILRWVEGDEEL